VPKYKLGPASIRGVPPQLIVRRPLVCQRCFEALGNVDSASEFSMIVPLAQHYAVGKISRISESYSAL